MRLTLTLTLFLIVVFANAQDNTFLYQDDSGNVSVTKSLTGEIRMFAGSNAPAGWAICDGSSLDTTTNNALFTVIQYTYGGSGTNFNLPDMRGRTAIGAGTGAGLVPRTLGESIGIDSILISKANLPMDSITIEIPTSTATISEEPAGRLIATTVESSFANPPPEAGEEMAPFDVPRGGSDIPISIIQPSVVINYIIAL